MLQHSELDEKNDSLTIMLNYFEDAIHDIKTPVSIILSILQTLELQNDIPPNAHEQILKIKKYCNKVLKQIHEITDFSKISGGHFLPRYVNYDIIYLSESITHSISSLAARKNIDIIFDTNVEEKIMAIDKDIYERILLNLLSNAIKFTPMNAVIDVDVNVEGDVFSMDIIDSGCGISDDRLNTIFERYETTRNIFNEEGTGVGLNIVKELLAVLNGTIIAKHRTDSSGTIMHIELPIFIVEDDTDEIIPSHGFPAENISQIELINDSANEPF